MSRTVAFSRSHTSFMISSSCGVRVACFGLMPILLVLIISYVKHKMISIHCRISALPEVVTSVLGCRLGLEAAGKIENFDVVGAVGPVVAPADDDVAAFQRVAVFAEVFALKFKLDIDALPAVGCDQ